jgi:hypothetical protein
LPARIADIAYQNKAVIYDLLFKASSETMLTIAADPKHLGARIGILAVLHTWGSALTHHPHVHVIVPGGGFSLDRNSWVACRPNFFLSVRVLSRLFRRLLLDKLAAAHAAGELQFFGNHAQLADAKAFAAYLAPLRQSEWVVYSKRPFGGPEEVLRYLARYTHRVAISNRRLVACDDKGVTFKWKDYRIEGPERYKLMTLPTDEFIHATSGCEQMQQGSPYSITSSARASSVGGTSRPSAFAVLRLITSSNLVGACTGRSVGFSPLRMRST